MPPRSSPLRIVTAVAALLVALFAVWWRQRHPEFALDGPVLLLGAVFLLFVAWRWPVTSSASGGEEAPPDPRPLQPTLPGWVEPPGTGERRSPPPPIQLGEERLRPVERRETEPSNGGPWLSFSLRDVAPWRIAAFFVSLLYIGASLRYLVVTPPEGTFTWAVLFWGGAILCFLLAVAPPVKRPRASWRMWWEIHRIPASLVVAIFVVALLLRVSNLDTLPHTLGGDEAAQGMEALRVIRGELRNPFSTAWLNVPTMGFFYNSISLRLLGEGVAALRLPWGILGAATVLLVFWLVTRLRGAMLGFITAALLTTYHYHIHFSRLGSNQIADPFFLALALLFLYRARDRNSPLDWAMAGIVAGVAQFSYAGARLTAVVLFACIGYFLLVNLKRRALFRDLVGGALNTTVAFFISAAPMIQYAIRFPNEYNARLNDVGLIQTGLLDRLAASQFGGSRLAVIWDQFTHVFLAFNVYPDSTFWYGPGRPLMDSLWGPLFMLGLLYCTARVIIPRVDPRLFPMVIWWWSGMFLGGVLTDSPPASQRLITLAPAACFFVAIVLLRVTKYVLDALQLRDRRVLASVLALLVLGLSLTSVRWYFVDYAALRCSSLPTCYGNPNAEMATELAYYLADNLEENEQVVMVGAPFVYVGLATIPYLAPLAADGVDAPPDPLSGPPSSDWVPVDPSQEPLFVFPLNYRLRELPFVQAAYPGGDTTEVTDIYGKTVATIYDPTP